MPSNRSTVTPTDVASILGTGVAQSYVGDENWIDPSQVDTRASQELDIIKQVGGAMADQLNDPTLQKAFIDGFTAHYTANAPQTA